LYKIQSIFSLARWQSYYILFCIFYGKNSNEQVV